MRDRGEGHVGGSYPGGIYHGGRDTKTLKLKTNGNYYVYEGVRPLVNISLFTLKYF